MLKPIDEFYERQSEPVKSCLQFLRLHILKRDALITESWQYGMPFFCFDGKRFCYLWIHKKLRSPYLGIVDGKKVNHPDLISEKRARMKILLIDAEKDLPLRKIDRILNEALGAIRNNQ